MGEDWAKRSQALSQGIAGGSQRRNIPLVLSNGWWMGNPSQGYTLRTTASWPPSQPSSRATRTSREDGHAMVLQRSLQLCVKGRCFLQISFVDSLESTCTSPGHSSACDGPEDS